MGGFWWKWGLLLLIFSRPFVGASQIMYDTHLCHNVFCAVDHNVGPIWTLDPKRHYLGIYFFVSAWTHFTSSYSDQSETLHHIYSYDSGQSARLSQQLGDQGFPGGQGSSWLSGKHTCTSSFTRLCLHQTDNRTTGWWCTSCWCWWGCWPALPKD